ncbi:MAG: tetratricopeptide repeat protein [Symploca sp. SIO1B1]|nr:tetratricopeptide repeat protein [Symploca sp. SIO1A3]NER95589.1 tetratricopeptide repeat protein [Symploca sp. SIO1B1]
MTVVLCQKTLGMVTDYRLLHSLARAEKELGEVEQANQDYQQALAICPAADEKEKSAIIHNLGSLKADTGDIAGAIALYEQSLETFEGIGNLQGKTSTLAMLGQLLVTAQEYYKTGLDYLQQSLDILKHLQSPEAEKVKEIIAEVQKRIKN